MGLVGCNIRWQPVSLLLPMIDLYACKRLIVQWRISPFGMPSWARWVLMAFWDEILQMSGETWTNFEPTLKEHIVLFSLKWASAEVINCIEKDGLPVSSDKTVSRIAVKASKAGDAKINTWMCDSKMVSAFPQLQTFAWQYSGEHRWWIYVCWLSKWMKDLDKDGMFGVPQGNSQFWLVLQTKEIRKDSDAIADIVHQVYHCNWWEWYKCLTLFFLKMASWHPDFKSCTHKGIPVWMIGNPHSEDMKEKVRMKLSKVRDRGYIEQGYVKSLTSYFPVQNGLQHY
jgi:hypothetical protein